jgi:hypothetical protein
VATRLAILVAALLLMLALLPCLVAGVLVFGA